MAQQNSDHLDNAIDNIWVFFVSKSVIQYLHQIGFELWEKLVNQFIVVDSVHHKQYCAVQILSIEQVWRTIEPS